MLREILDFFSLIFGAGLDTDEFAAYQIILRALVIYAVSVALVKYGSRRLFGRATVFDNIVAIMLGSIMSRGIITTELVPTMIAGGTLIGLHWLFALISVKTKSFGPVVKGEPVLLVKDGIVQEDGMQEASISKNDLIEALRLQVRHTDLSKIDEAYLERNGKISIIPSASEPRVLEVKVENGVQTVRIKME